MIEVNGFLEWSLNQFEEIIFCELDLTYESYQDLLQYFSSIFVECWGETLMSPIWVSLHEIFNPTSQHIWLELIGASGY